MVVILKIPEASIQESLNSKSVCLGVYSLFEHVDGSQGKYTSRSPLQYILNTRPPPPCACARESEEVERYLDSKLPSTRYIPC